MDETTVFSLTSDIKENFFSTKSPSVPARMRSPSQCNTFHSKEFLMNSDTFPKCTASHSKAEVNQLPHLSVAELSNTQTHTQTTYAF